MIEVDIDQAALHLARHSLASVDEARLDLQRRIAFIGQLGGRVDRLYVTAGSSEVTAAYVSPERGHVLGVLPRFPYAAR